MLIRWEKKLELGNALIDTQHRIMLVLCRKLDIAIKTQQTEQTIRFVILELKKFTEFHFISEENLMREIGYPDLSEHAFIHTELLMQLNGMMSKINNHSDVPDDLLGFLNRWLMKHIVDEDFKIAKYAKHANSPPIGENLYEPFL